MPFQGFLSVESGCILGYQCGIIRKVLPVMDEHQSRCPEFVESNLSFPFPSLKLKLMSPDSKLRLFNHMVGDSVKPSPTGSHPLV